MSHLQSLLDEVLSARRVIQDPATFRLLKRFAPDKEDQLNELETKSQQEPQGISATENTIPKSHNAIHLTRNDLEGILHHRQSTTIEEIEWLLAHANDPRLMLTYTEEAELRSVATRLLADQHLAQARARNDEFIVKHLDTIRTPHGDLSHAELARLEQIRAKGIQAIRSCKSTNASDALAGRMHEKHCSRSAAPQVRRARSAWRP